MTNDELKKLRALHARTSPGPWTIHTSDGPFKWVERGIVWTSPQDTGGSAVSDFLQTTPENAQFIVAAHEAVPKLLAEIELLVAENAEQRDKALRYDVDQAGIARREAEAVELVELRAKVAEMKERGAARQYGDPNPHKGKKR